MSPPPRRPKAFRLRPEPPQHGSEHRHRLLQIVRLPAGHDKGGGERCGYLLRGQQLHAAGVGGADGRDGALLDTIAMVGLCVAFQRRAEFLEFCAMLYKMLSSL